LQTMFGAWKKLSHFWIDAKAAEAHFRDMNIRTRKIVRRIFLYM